MSDELTRKQVADRLGLSVSSVRRLEREGVLTPAIGQGGVRLFCTDQVEAVRVYRERNEEPEGLPTVPAAQTLAPTDGALAALAFAHFDQGETPIQVVQALELSPDRVKQLYTQWRELGNLVFETW